MTKLFEIICKVVAIFLVFIIYDILFIISLILWDLSYLFELHNFIKKIWKKK